MIDGLPVIDGLVLLAMSVFGYRLAWIQRRIADEPDLEAEDHSWRLMTETSRSNMVAYSWFLAAAATLFLVGGVWTILR